MKRKKKRANPHANGDGAKGNAPSPAQRSYLEMLARLIAMDIIENEQRIQSRSPSGTSSCKPSRRVSDS